MGWRRRRDSGAFGLEAHEVDELARYNGEVARGLMHTQQWRERMQLLQSRYDDGMRSQPNVIWPTGKP